MAQSNGKDVRKVKRVSEVSKDSAQKQLNPWKKRSWAPLMAAVATAQTS